jgi:hypothetical protein
MVAGAATRGQQSLQVFWAIPSRRSNGELQHVCRGLHLSVLDFLGDRAQRKGLGL